MRERRTELPGRGQSLLTKGGESAEFSIVKGELRSKKCWRLCEDDNSTLVSWRRHRKNKPMPSALHPRGSFIIALPHALQLIAICGVSPENYSAVTLARPTRRLALWHLSGPTPRRKRTIRPMPTLPSNPLPSKSSSNLRVVRLSRRNLPSASVR
jgi:hypothetical protein